MKQFNLCLLGFGNVGRALAGLLVEKREEMRERYLIEWRVTGVASRRLGWHAAPEGFEVPDLLSGAAFARRACARAASGGAAAAEWLDAARADVLFETTSLDPHTGEPAVSYLRAALERGAHAITANKGPVVHAHRELAELARARGRRFMFESTVADCLPVFSLFREALPAARLEGFRGLLNSTTNVILEEVGAGSTFGAGVARAQALGITEADPAYDVDGWDAAVKTCALANVLMGAGLSLAEVRRAGVRGLDAGDVREARAAGTPYRLVARAARDAGGRLAASVGPERVPRDDPFSIVPGTSLMIHFELDVLPGLSLIAHGPDLRSTAYGLLADFINAARG